MARSIDFYFDFSSPYGYLASTRIDAIGQKHGLPVVWRPILLGVVFKQINTIPNALQPLKGDYLRHEVARTARRLGVPWNPPERMPFGTVTACRAFYHVVPKDPVGAVRLARGLYDAAFTRGRDICPVESVVGIAAELGFDPDDIMAGLQTASVKERLKQEVDASIARGVFGSPFMIVDNEPFWGNDRLEEMDLWLGSGGW